MATDLLNLNFDWGNIFGVSYYTILIVMLLVFGVLGIYLLWNFMNYNKNILVRKIIAGGRKVILKDKAREYKDKDGVIKYKFLKLKITAPIPTPEAIEVDKRGKEFLECYLSETGEVQWITDKNDKINSLAPFTTNQRQMLQHEFYKAHLEKGFKFSDYLMPIVFVGALVILIISLLVFYGDIAKPVLDMGDKVSGMQKQQIDMQEKMNEMLDKVNAMLNATYPYQQKQVTFQPIINKGGLPD